MKRLVFIALSTLAMRAHAQNTDMEQAVTPCDTTELCNDTLTNTPITIYDAPYSRTLSMPDKRGVLYNTAALYGAGVVTLGVLELLPEDATAWNKTELHKTPLFERWWQHVSHGPVWDHDNAIFDYVLHPYGGAAYYMSARSRGFNMWQSALYSAAVSTLFWEYGIEAFMEYPSIQDLIITPVVGSVIGECFYKVKRHIVACDYRLCGSGLLGHTVAWLVDPVNEFVYLFTGNPTRHHIHANLTTLPHHLSLVVTF
ncbi:MAG: DUF3943 domain-containing protein [Muribaculaceae bacterium]|nr:DUF3943 domain-containing protein [Muribaculaceae bacterium]